MHEWQHTETISRGEARFARSDRPEDRAHLRLWAVLVLVLLVVGFWVALYLFAVANPA